MNLRQLKYGAGGSSYKSTWTLQELFPLTIVVVNVNFLEEIKKEEKWLRYGSIKQQRKGKGLSDYHYTIILPIYLLIYHQKWKKISVLNCNDVSFLKSFWSNISITDHWPLPLSPGFPNNISDGICSLQHLLLGLLPPYNCCEWSTIKNI